MQSPFWIHEIGPIRDILESQFMKLVTAASLIGVNYIVVPLVDNGSMGQNLRRNCKLLPKNGAKIKGSES